ncbi:hypothetical protein QBC38DRAFT_476060 [Podospora fimiseda]|uniref:Indole-diterpene biosynthesis protein PaxU n=1 Tax=Podospora fimiseda TaxID=252190 RepID=A0AAN7BR55_9PEZI|nr:hypothetical protein QBC38DRAFT_476060 [Podospora fimiseda]
MATTTATTPTSTNPLSFMTKISPCAYIYTPSSSPPAGTDPKLILLSTWMSARPTHILKYLTPYLSLYPSSPILLLRSSPRHFLSPFSLPQELDPAVTYFQSIFSNDTPPSDISPQPQLLIHAFSNGGSLLYALLRLRITINSLPRYTIIFDSTPGQFRYWPSFWAFTASFSGWRYWIIAPVMHLIVSFFYVWHVIIGRGKSGPLAKLAAGHNDFEKLGGREVRRTYIYGKGDKLVDWRDVEEHAGDAENRGFKSVRKEEFVGTGHVAHGRGEGNVGRYWGVVRGTWEGK